MYVIMYVVNSIMYWLKKQPFYSGLLSSICQGIFIPGPFTHPVSNMCLAAFPQPPYL